jgi:5-methylcytosine-specific restriction endonuclease McrA
MGRRSLSPTARLRIFQDHHGVCDICGGFIDGIRDPWDLDHRIPLALGGEDTDANLRPVHARCHRGAGSKTSADVAQIAKAKRVERKHMGAHRPKAKIAYRKFDGTPVYPKGE